jgi:cytochrome c peroxidase
MAPALIVIALLAGARMVRRSGAEIMQAEGLAALPALVGDRLRLEQVPSIAPPLVSADRPQSFFVHARPNARVRVRFGARAAALEAHELGEGLFRVEYDPRRDGPPAPSDGPLLAEITVDDRSVQRAMLASTPLPHPRWLALSADRRLAATVSEETDELVIVSPRGLERRVKVGDGPIDCAFVGTRRIAISHRDDPALWIVDTDTGARLQSVAIGQAQGRMALSPDGRLLAVARGGRAPEIALIPLPAAARIEHVALDAVPDWIAYGADAGTLVVSIRADATLRRLRRGPDGVLREDARLVLGRAAVTLARSNDGARIFVATTDYRPDGHANLANHFVQDQILTLEVARMRVVSALLTARRTPRQSKPGDVDRGISPLGMSPSADGALLVAFAGSDEIWRLRDGTAEPEIIDLAGSGLYTPHGIAELDDGTLAVTSPTAGAVGLVPPAAPKPQLLRLSPDDDYLLAHNKVALARRLGERGFYEGTRSGISCQSCHLHADSDQSAHNLGTHKLLPTLSVRGIAGTAPYLRDGSFPRIGDLDHVAQTLYRGYLRRAPGRAQTLEAFVASLPRAQSTLDPNRRDLTRERRGLHAFVRGACPTCHAFPAFTSLGQHLFRGMFPERGAHAAADDVLDVPSLLSLGTSAPYLSDGRARTLQAVLSTENRSNRHGDTARLTSTERSDLCAFLESL